ncbi:MAG: helix-turn-helix domain-containing protein [Thermoplasmata archaeon]
MIEIMEKIAGEIVMSDNPGITMKKWRELFELTQSSVAQKMKISPSVLSDYENGKRSPGVLFLRRFVESLINIDYSRGSPVLKKINRNYGKSAIIDIREFLKPVRRDEIVSAIDGKILYGSKMDRELFGYTIVDSVKAILEFSSNDYYRIYGYSNERAIFFVGVKYGRSPMVAVRAHPLKPNMVIFVHPENVDSLSIRLAELEDIPLVVSDMDIKKIIENLRKI